MLPDTQQLERLEALLLAGQPKAALPELLELTDEPDAVAAPSDPLRARALLLRGRAQLALEQWSAAEESADAAQEAYADLGDARGLRRARLVLAQARLFNGQPLPGRLFAQEALAGAEAEGDAEAVALASYVLGMAARQLDDLAASEAYLRRALAGWEAIGQPRYVNATLMALGSTLVRLGQADEADRLYAAVEAHAAPAQDHALLARVLNQRALIAWAAADYAQARELLARKLELEEGVGSQQAFISTLHNLATVELHAGNFELAKRRALRALSTLGDTALHGMHADLCGILGLAELHLGAHGDLAAGIERIRQGLLLLRGGAPSDGDALSAYLALLLLADDQPEAAAAAWERRPRGSGVMERMTQRVLERALRALSEGALPVGGAAAGIRAQAAQWLAELTQLQPDHDG